MLLKRVEQLKYQVRPKAKIINFYILEVHWDLFIVVRVKPKKVPKGSSQPYFGAWS